MCASETGLKPIKMPAQASIDLDTITSQLGHFTEDAILITEAEPFVAPGPRILWCNPAFLAMTGYSYEEVIGSTPRIMQGPDTSSHATQRIASHLRDWKPVRQDILNYRKDGTSFWVELSIMPVSDATGWFHYWVSFQRDITERKENELELLQAREELRSSNYKLAVMHERYEVAVRGSSVGLWDWDTVTNDLFWSPRFMEIIGLETDDFVPNFSEFHHRLHPEDQIRVMDAIDAHLTERHPYSIDYRLRRSDGDYVWIHARGQAIWDASGQAIRMAGSVEDISQQVIAERALAAERDALVKAKKKAEAGERAKSLFLANMSHEIRTPLNCILGMTQLLKDPAFAEKRDEYIDHIHGAGENLLAILSNVLELSQTEGDQDTQHCEEFSVRDLMTGLENSFQAQASQKGLFLDVAFRHPYVDQRYGQYGSLLQILQNLIGNAIKFTEKGGVTLVVGQSHDNSSWLDIAVVDTGIGIPDAMIHSVFDAFNQAETGFNKRFEGVGLGLTITKKLVETMNGNIQVISREGDGSTFKVSLPLAYGNSAGRNDHQASHDDEAGMFAAAQ